MVGLILKVLAAVCFALLVFHVHLGTVPLLALGLLLWVVGDLLGGYGPALRVARE